MEAREITVEVNGESKRVVFDTAKLYKKVEDFVNDYEFEYEDVVNGVEHTVALGGNTSMVFRVSSYTDHTKMGAGCDELEFEVEADVVLLNKKYQKRTVIRFLIPDCWTEFITDEWRYYGVSQKDFL